MRIFRKKEAKNKEVVKSAKKLSEENTLSDKQGIIWIKNKNGIYKTGTKLKKTTKK